MKKSVVFLLLAGVCVVSLAGGFALGNFKSHADDQSLLVETTMMELKLTFKPEANDLMREIGEHSLRYYSQVLTTCLSEKDNMEKINSTKILADLIAVSCLINATRPRISQKKDPEEKIPEKKHDL